MPWCPNCGEEYREGFDLCKDCNCGLVDELPPLPPPSPKATPPQPPVNEGWHMAHRKDYTLPGPMEQPVLLTTTADPVQLEMLLDLLGQVGIHAFAADDSTGRYTRLYMGVSVYAREVYVEQTQLAEAQTLLAEYFSEGETEPLPPEDEYDYEEPKEDYGYPLQESKQPFGMRRSTVQNAILIMLILAAVSLVFGAISIVGSFFEEPVCVPPCQHTNLPAEQFPIPEFDNDWS